jgi:putative ABC transport system substrate-binding protein
MRRREFIAILGGALAATSIFRPFTAHAQQKVWRIGLLLVGGPEFMGPYRTALRDLGYIEGKNIQIETRSAGGQIGRLPELAAELVHSKVDIIVASLTPAATAAKSATRDIPIIMAPAGDPIGTGLVTSLARPGGNVTGLSALGAELNSKNLEVIREILPTARRVAVLANPSDPFSKPFLEQILKGAQAAGFDIQPAMVRRGEDLEGAFATMSRERVEAILGQAGFPLKITADLALKYRLPIFVAQKSAVQAGFLASYSPSFEERGREIAGYVDKILKGAKPADLPVQQPSTFELTINLKTAKALGVTIAPALLNRADEVIE